MSGFGGIAAEVEQKARELVAQRVDEMCNTLNSRIAYEFSTDFPISNNDDLIGANVKDRKAAIENIIDKFRGVTFKVTESSGMEYTIQADVSGLSEKEKEVFNLYYGNSKNFL